MTTFRKTVMATTMLAGFAIFALDAAQAGPNGGPSLGSISGFSSMRMDFNRVGGPNRALSRDDTRVVPLDVKKTEKHKDTKNAAKKGTDVARVLNPKSTKGGKGKEVASAPALRIPAPLAEIYRVTGGNLDDISQLAELATWLKTGLPGLGSPLFPMPAGGSFAVPLPEELGRGAPKPDGNEPDRNFLDGWAGYTRTPGGADSSKTGWAGIWTHVSTNYDGQGSRRSTYYDSATDRHATVTSYSHGNETRREIVITGRDAQGNRTRDQINHSTYTDDRGHVVRTRDSRSEDTVDNGDRTTTTTTFYTHKVTEDGTVVEDTSSNTTTTKDDEGNVIETTEEKSGQPVEEGTGRPGRNGWCSPTGGCVTASVIKGPQVIPASDASTPEMRSQLPSWATDPCPDCTSRGGGGGYSGYDPRNEGDGNVGGNGGRGTPL